MDNQVNKKAAGAFASSFAAALTEPLSKALGVTAVLAVKQDAEVETSQERPVHFRLNANGGARGQCFVEFYEPLVAEAGAKILGKASAGFVPEHADALGKVIASALPALSAALAPEHPGLTFKVDQVSDLACGGMLVVPMSLAIGEKPERPVLLYFDQQMVATLTSASAAREGSAEFAFDPTNLKLVMDVELTMSLRFGQCQMPLREVLDLASGSVIELDRHVEDPVELLLDGKVIARGEAVIVDGNYGLRVTEVPHPIASHFSR
jgi:flagellar motor switch protein FliN/FliY